MLAAHIQSVDLSYHVSKRTIGLKRMQLQGSSHTESLSNWQNEGGGRFLHSVCRVLVSQSPWVQYVCQPWLTGQAAFRQGRVFADTMNRVFRNVKCFFLLGNLCLWLAALVLEHAPCMLSLEMSVAASSDRCSWDESGVRAQ